MRVALVFAAVAVTLCAFAAVADAQRVLPAGQSPHAIPPTRHEQEQKKAQAKASSPAPAPAQCAKESYRSEYCRGVAKVPKGKWAVSQNAPWASAYLKCLNQCAAKDLAVAPPNTPLTRAAFRSAFKSQWRVVKAKKTVKPTRTPAKAPAPVKPATATTAAPKKSLLELKGKALGKALTASGASAEFDPTKPIQNLLITVLRGVDLAQQVLDGKGKQIWQALRCPACQVAILRLYQKGCGAIADAVCRAVSGVACGQYAKLCNAVICPAIDPLFSGECMNIVNAIQQFPDFKPTVPYEVCKTIHMCFPGDENFGEGMN